MLLMTVGADPYPHAQNKSNKNGFNGQSPISHAFLYVQKRPQLSATEQIINIANINFWNRCDCGSVLIPPIKKHSNPMHTPNCINAVIVVNTFQYIIINTIIPVNNIKKRVPRNIAVALAHTDHLECLLI